MPSRLAFISWVFLVLLCGFLANSPVMAETGWKLIRTVTKYDRYYLTDPGCLEQIKKAGNLACSVSGGHGSTGATGWFEFDFDIPQTGWYELFSGYPSGDVEFIIDPPSDTQTTTGLYVYGGNGMTSQGDKISNIWLAAGKHTLRIQRYVWTGFPPIPSFTIQQSTSELTETIRTSLAGTGTIFRKGECPPLQIFSGGRERPSILTVRVNDAATGAHRSTTRVNVPASKNIEEQQIPVYCQQEGDYSITFGDTVGHPFDNRDLREIAYEVIDTTPHATRVGELKKTLSQEIDCATTPPDYSDSHGTHVVHKKFGSYREAGDIDWIKYQPLNGYLRKLAPEPSWFAYKLHVTDVQHPYVIEVDYPDDAVRTFAIVLRESDPLAYPVAGGVDSGAEFQLSEKMLTHTLIYWPRALDTRIVFMTARTGTRAAAGRIRVYRVESDLPALQTPVNSGRYFANWYEEGADFLSMYGAPDESINGIRTATERWAEAVVYMGGSVLFPTTVIYNFALYPSRYNKAFSTSPNNDVLRRMLLVAEKHGMKLLPELHPRADELAWPYAMSPDPKPNLLVSKDGQTLKNLPPYYNPIYPANQNWYVNMIGELVDNYKDSPALLGVSLRLMQWQNPTLNNFQSLDWGYDDFTVGLFERETGITVPGGLTDALRFRKRYDWLMAHAKEQWVSWRCEKIAQLYKRIRDRVRQARPDLKVYSTAFDGYPSAFGASWLRDAGIDPQMLAQIDGVVLINALHAYGRRYDEESTQGTRDNLLDPTVLNAMNAPTHSGKFLSYARYFEATETVLPPEKLGFPAATKKTWMSAVINPAGRNYLERYAVELAETDASWLGDGGNAYTLGQPELREFLQEYRLLPSAHFIARPDARDPIAVWELTRAMNYLFYAVNRERFPVNVQLRLNGPREIYRLSTGHKMIIQKNILSLQLQPYQLMAFRASKDVRIMGVTTIIPAEDLKRVTTQVQWLETLNNDVQNGRVMQILANTQRQTLNVAAEQARIALNQGHVWRARTIMENHELLSVYKDVGRFPPELRSEGRTDINRSRLDNDALVKFDLFGKK